MAAEVISRRLRVSPLTGSFDILAKCLSNSLNTYLASLSPSNATTIGCALFQVDISFGSAHSKLAALPA
jgi:hypothetical protein